MTRKWKGAAGELEVARALQEWWRRLEPAAVFIRTPRSGGWASSQAVGLKARGDVMIDPTTCSKFVWSVEVKFRKVITPVAIEHFVAGAASPIAGYWRQCQAAALADGLRPLLVFRGNRQPWRCAFLPRVPTRLPNGDRVHVAGSTIPCVRLLDTMTSHSPDWFLDHA